MKAPTFTCSRCGAHSGLSMFRDAEVCILCYLAAVRYAESQGIREQFTLTAEREGWNAAAGLVRLAG